MSTQDRTNFSIDVRDLNWHEYYSWRHCSRVDRSQCRRDRDHWHQEVHAQGGRRRSAQRQSPPQAVLSHSCLQPRCHVCADTSSLPWCARCWAGLRCRPRCCGSRADSRPASRSLPLCCATSASPSSCDLRRAAAVRADRKVLRRAQFCAPRCPTSRASTPASRSSSPAAPDISARWVPIPAFLFHFCGAVTRLTRGRSSLRKCCGRVRMSSACTCWRAGARACRRWTASTSCATTWLVRAARGVCPSPPAVDI